ncbi:MAG: carboxypeptidase regulatory-like domain-containing protein, partial [Candidatus Marinimicrobia bacterium]|nr:carboxypeptidase regulatory-like domain-containing protein [Candidatus Neomarinimicrobiota bacterium]
SGEVAIWIDIDQNGILDPAVDMDIDDGGSFFDNGFEDEDPNSGIFQITLGGDDEEGFSRVALAQFLFEVTDAGGSDTAWVYIEPLVSTNSFAGAVTPAVANVIIGAFPTMDDTGGPDGPDGPGEAPWMTLTDSSGNYQLAVPDTGYYDVFAFDFLGVQDGLIADTSYHMVAAAANRTDLDFTFIEPTSFIEGFVTDNSGLPVTGVLVFAGGGPGGEQEDSTDGTGFYSIGVAPGHYRVEVDEDIIPDYMGPEGQEVEVLDGESVTANFTLYVADATISGMVTLDGSPLAGIEIGAWGYPVGWTFGVSGFDGIYTLHVSSEVDFEGYSLWPHDQPDSTFFANQLWNIPPGANGVDIDFVTAAGGIFGAVTAAGTLDTLFNVFIEVEDTTGNRFPGGVDFETGEYSIPLPDGVYKVFAGAEGFFPFESDSTVTVAGSFVPFDIELDSVVADAAIEGVITDVNGGFSLGGVEVWVWNPMLDYGDHTFTDSSGFYHIDIPNGEYEIWTFLEGYREAYDLVTVPPGPTVTKDFALEQFTFEAPYITRIIDRGRSDHADDEPDQGGWVYLEFEGGGTQEGPFVGWSIWRVPGPDYFPEQMVSVGFVNFHGEPHYTALVTTRADSGAAYPTPEEYLSHYVVTGYTGGEWFDSDPQAGYSVDNIAPGVPAGVQIIGIANG